MRPIKFDGANVTFGEGQEGVQPLPAHRDPRDPAVSVTTCYELEPGELAAIARTGKVWLQIWTFGQPLQPQRMSIDCPLEEPPKIAELPNTMQTAKRPV